MQQSPYSFLLNHERSIKENFFCKKSNFRYPKEEGTLRLKKSFFQLFRCRIKSILHRKSWRNFCFNPKVPLPFGYHVFFPINFSSELEKIFGRQRGMIKLLAFLLLWYSILSSFSICFYKLLRLIGKIISLIELCMVINPRRLSFHNRFTVLPDGRILEGREFFLIKYFKPLNLLLFH